MPAAGTLLTNSVRVGVTAEEIAQIALDNEGQSWHSEGCAAFVWGVANLAGAPFFDFNDRTTSGDPTRPENVPYIVPHSPGILSGTDDVGGDGWSAVDVSTNVATLTSQLRAGDLVRVYREGNSSEATFLPGGGIGGHSFIVTSVEGGTVQVADNWFGSQIYLHNLSDITNSFASSGNFQAVFVSRLNEEWVANNFPQTVAGNGIGDFSGIVPASGGGPTPPPDETFSGTLVDNLSFGRTQETTIENNELVSSITVDSADNFNWRAHLSQYHSNGEVDSLTVLYDDGRLEYSTCENDLLTRALTIDRDDAHNWNYTLQEFDSAGNLERFSWFYDDGTVSVLDF